MGSDLKDTFRHPVACSRVEGFSLNLFVVVPCGDGTGGKIGVRVSA